ncbi:MAG: hypothetical protein GY796_30165 [Chloroflexi bacterium]|nr:hypothetical protein [Chloroflexota bacterium]
MSKKRAQQTTQKGEKPVKRPSPVGASYQSVQAETSYLYYDLDEPGVYTLSVVYENKYRGEDVGLNAWVGKLQANTIMFELII